VGRVVGVLGLELVGEVAADLLGEHAHLHWVVEEEVIVAEMVEVGVEMLMVEMLEVVWEEGGGGSP
jgi:hypothetical protein